MTSNPSVIIIGAGMTGIGAAYYLRANGIPYTILEAKSDLGGVWNTHRWHGREVRLRLHQVLLQLQAVPFGAMPAEPRADPRLSARRGEGVLDRRSTSASTAAWTRRCSIRHEQRWTVHTSRGRVQRAVPAQRQRLLRRRAACASVRRTRKNSRARSSTPRTWMAGAASPARKSWWWAAARRRSAARRSSRACRKSARPAAEVAVLHLRNQQPGGISASGFARTCTALACAARCNGCATTFSSGTTWSSSAFAAFLASRAGSSAAIGSARWARRRSGAISPRATTLGSSASR